MNCQNCGENEANIRYTQIINGVKKQMNLCEKCAKELGIEDMNLSMPISFSSFLGDMLDIYDETIPSLISPKTLTCPKCNMAYEDFIETGKFGCENCYEEFKTKLDPLLKNIHGANRHIGRTANFNEKDKNLESINNLKQDKKAEEKNIKKAKNEKTKLQKLQERLKQEIKEERYEDAAKTRDEIKKIK